MAKKFDYIFYGTKCNSKEVRSFLQHVFENNEIAEEKGRKRTPLCIWGKYGVGKTELVEELAKENGWGFTYIAPAQFEEMGDLTGVPKVITKENGEDTTVLIPPDWVPKEEGPGIFLIDDVNRADDRILRGIMQLLQNFELTSWKLPPKWQIVLTANPDGGDYSVTPMDNAMLTRMHHISMEFDAKMWAAWAEKSGIDPRGINFVLAYPESVQGDRTTPRTMVQFFESIGSIDDLKKELDLVKILGDSCLDSETVGSFLAFVQQNLSTIVSPEEILDGKNFTTTAKKISDQVNQDIKRVDTLAVICTRLLNYIIVNKMKLTKKQNGNLVSFLKMDLLPNDLRLTIAQDLVDSANPSLSAVLRTPEIAKLLLQKM
ncbi:MAG: hypothetical protein ACI86H_000474 [bacterium]|jgi:hypothetical protein